MSVLDIAQVRPVLESEIERLINALDLLDGDTDFEDTFDQEEVSEDEGASCDEEPDGDGEGTGNYMGPCSPIAIGGDHHA